MSPLWGYLHDSRRKIHPPAQQISFVSGDRSLQMIPQSLQRKVEHFLSLNDKQQNPVSFITQLKVSSDTDDDLYRTIRFSFGTTDMQLAAAKYTYGNNGYIFVVQDVKYNRFEGGRPFITVPPIAASIHLQDSVSKTHWRIWNPRKLHDSRWDLCATIAVATGSPNQLNPISLKYEQEMLQDTTSAKTENLTSSNTLHHNTSINDCPSRLDSDLQGSSSSLGNKSWDSRPPNSLDDSQDTFKLGQDPSNQPSLSTNSPQLRSQVEPKTEAKMSEKRRLTKDENEASESKVAKKQRNLTEETVMNRSTANTTSSLRSFTGTEPSHLPSARKDQVSDVAEAGQNASDDKTTPKDTDMKEEPCSDSDTRVNASNIEVQFQFRKELHGIPTRTRPFSDISSSERLFKQASCANILHYGGDILSIHFDGCEPINIMRNDDEDYDRVVELIERQKVEQPTRSAVVVIVTPAEW